MSDEAKGKIYLFIFLVFAGSLAYVFWNNVRPKIIGANCSDAAFQASQTYSRLTLPSDNPKSYDEVYNDCVLGLGYKKTSSDK